MQLLYQKLGYDSGVRTPEGSEVIVFNHFQLKPSPAVVIMAFNDGRLLRTVTRNVTPICERIDRVDFSLDGKQALLRSGNECPASMMEIGTWRELWQGRDVSNRFSPDGKFVLGMQGPDMPLYDIHSGKVIRHLGYPWNEARDADLIFSKDSQFLYFGLSSANEAWKVRIQ